MYRDGKKLNTGSYQAATAYVNWACPDKKLCILVKADPGYHLDNTIKAGLKIDDVSVSSTELELIRDQSNNVVGWEACYSDSIYSDCLEQVEIYAYYHPSTSKSGKGYYASTGKPQPQGTKKSSRVNKYYAAIGLELGLGCQGLDVDECQNDSDCIRGSGDNVICTRPVCKFGSPKNICDIEPQNQGESCDIIPKADKGNTCYNRNVCNGKQCTGAYYKDEDEDCAGPDPEPPACVEKYQCVQDQDTPGRTFCDPVVQPKDFLCRKSDGDCDVAEVCDGKSPKCPRDKFKARGTSCSTPGARGMYHLPYMLVLPPPPHLSLLFTSNL